MSKTTSLPGKGFVNVWGQVALLEYFFSFKENGLELDVAQQQVCVNEN